MTPVNLDTKNIIDLQKIDVPNIVGLLKRHSLIILVGKSSRESGLVAFTLLFRCPRNKISKGARSGDLGGHSTVPLLPIHRPGNSSF